MRLLLLALLPVALSLGGCPTDGNPWQPPVASGDDDDDDGVFCPATDGQPGVEFMADDESHAALADGATFDIAQRPQGDVTIFTPLQFAGLDGGTIVDGFSIVFVDHEGEERGARQNTRFQLPCEDDGDVAAHYYEVFFGNPTIPPSTYDGMKGTLTVSFTTPDGAILSDALSAEIRDASP